MPKHLLDGHVAVVAGATRGCGRGIARALGEAGATVYCTGRSTAGNPSNYRRPETIEETAELVTRAGGVGIAIRVDHGNESQVAALFDRVVGERGRLDILVNTIAGEDPNWRWNDRFWDTDIENLIGLVRQTVITHLITAKYAARYLIKQGNGLIVEVTDRDTLGYQGFGFAHDFVKAGVMRATVAMAGELRPKGVVAVAVTPGYLRSESMLARFSVSEENWRDGGKKDRHFLESETPLFLGRGVVALATDPNRDDWSGDTISSGELGRRYRVSDYDGRQPDIVAYFATNATAESAGVDGARRNLDWHRRILERAERATPAAARSAKVAIPKRQLGTHAKGK